MKNLTRWLKFLLLAGVLFVPSGCHPWFWDWDNGRHRDRDDRRGGDVRRGGDDEKNKDRPKDKDRPKEHAEEGHR
jgi:hypothetical protein